MTSLWDQILHWVCDYTNVSQLTHRELTTNSKCDLIYLCHDRWVRCATSKWCCSEYFMWDSCEYISWSHHDIIVISNTSLGVQTSIRISSGKGTSCWQITAMHNHLATRLMLFCCQTCPGLSRLQVLLLMCGPQKMWASSAPLMPNLCGGICHIEGDFIWSKC